MAGLRFTVDIFIPESSTGTIVSGVKIPTVLANKIPTIRGSIQDLKSYARKINEGNAGEEMTVRATYHICRHDEGKPCNTEVDI